LFTNCFLTDKDEVAVNEGPELHSAHTLVIWSNSQDLNSTGLQQLIGHARPSLCYTDTMFAREGSMPEIHWKLILGKFCIALVKL